MRHSRFAFFGLYAAAFSAAASLASARVELDMVTVGDPNNPNGPTGRGRVGYTFQISKYEVTNAQYTEFLNSVDPAGTNDKNLYSTFMGTWGWGGILFDPAALAGQKYAVRPGRADKPVTYVSLYDAARMVNWLNNGQGSADTERGVYDLSQSTLVGHAGSGAMVFLPSLDEWIKAAHYDPTPGSPAAPSNGYWNYATRSNTLPSSVAPPGTANSANYYDPATGYAVNGDLALNYTFDYLTNVGAYSGASSYYGTFDQNGNVYEWVDSSGLTLTDRPIMGGSWQSFGTSLRIDGTVYTGASGEYADVGFRIAAIPEPSALALLPCAALIAGRRRR